jgi:L-histidine N-alpha-methyltransferase
MTALHVERCLPEGYLDRALRADARAGLSASPKTLPPKWLYDENGSELFEKITQLDEYYPTRGRAVHPGHGGGRDRRRHRGQHPG